MIWLNPWAWIGLSALSVPILVHLLARRRAIRLTFPTLRFLPPSSRLSARRDRVSDLALLAVRAAVIFAAVAALAQPYLATPWRRDAAVAPLARAVLVDTSESMRRPAAAGGAAIDAARTEARTLASQASTSRVIETPDLPSAIAGSAAWIGAQPGRHEIAIVSDFQTGSITAGDLATIPVGTGIRPVPIAVPAGAALTAPPFVLGDRESTVAATATDSGTTAEWTTRAGSGTGGPALLLLAGPASQAGAEAARNAAASTGGPRTSPDWPVAIVFRDSPEWPALVSHAALIDRPWMFHAIDQLGRDETLGAAAAVTSAAIDRGATPTTDRSTVVIRNAAGLPLAFAASGDTGGSHRLLLFSLADAGSLLSAALAAGTTRAVGLAAPASELDPTSLTPEDLRTLERPATDVAPPAGRGDDASDGRWLWALAIGLLFVESRMRRRPEPARQPEVAHERVA